MKKYFYLLIIPILLSFNLHKLHLSNTKIVFDKRENTLQITMRCFADDIENVLNKNNNLVLELGNDRELEKSDELIKAYLSEKFKISINKSPIKWDYLGKEFEKDIVYFYLEINAVAATISHIKVTNNVLLEEFDDQQNIIRLSLNDKKKTFVLKNNDSTKELDF